MCEEYNDVCLLNLMSEGGKYLQDKLDTDENELMDV